MSAKTNLPAIRIVQEPASVLAELEDINEHIRWVMDKAKGVKDPETGEVYDVNAKVLLQAAEVFGRNVERQVKIARELLMFREGMVPREAFHRLTSLILGALEPYPEALRAVKGAIAEVEI